MKISSVVQQICQSKLYILPNKKYTIKNLPKTCKILPKWRNLAKSGHTELDPVQTLAIFLLRDILI